MKKSLLLLPSLLFLVACQDNNCVIKESNFFLVMTNILYYPEDYLNKDLSLDCFTYNVTDINDVNYLCGVRKCTAGYGCRCGKDSVIGFILNYEGNIPEPKNQYDDTNDKSWIHIAGKLSSKDKANIKMYSYDAEGNKTDTVEEIQFLSFDVTTLEIVTDYSNLHYFVSK